MGLFGGSNNQVEIQVVADTNEADKKFKELDSSISKIGSSSSGGGSGVDFLSMSLKGVGVAAVAATAAVAAVTAAVAALGPVLENASKVENLTRGFENLQKRVGSDSVNALNSLREATKGLITDLDLMQASNQAVLLGVDDGSGKFADMANAALKLGKAMGIDAKNALDSLVTGIGRGEKEILDNLGVVINAEDAYRRYADQIGTTADKLTELGKKEAIKAIATEAVIKSAADLSDTNGTAAEAYERLKVAMSNTYDQMSVGISNSETLTSILNTLTDVVTNLPDYFNRTTNALKGFIDKLIESRNPISDYIRVSKELWGILGSVTERAWNFGIALRDHGKSLMPLPAQVTKLNFSLENLGSESLDLNKGLDLLGDTTIKADKTFAGLKETQIKVTKSTEGLIKPTKEAGKKLYEMMDIGKELANQVLEKDLKQAVDELGDGFGNQQVKMERVVQVLNNLREAYIKMGLSAQSADNIIKGMDISGDDKTTQAKIDKVKDSLINEIPDFLGKSITEAILGGLENGLNSDTLKNLGRSVSQIFANDFQESFSKIFMKDAAGNLTGGIDWTQAMGSAASMGIAYGISSLTQNLSDNKKDGKGGVIGGAALGAGIGTQILPGWGTAIGAVVGAGAGYLAGSTGTSNNPDYRDRKDTVNFIEDKLKGTYLPFLTEQGNIILGNKERFNVKPGGSFMSSLGDMVVDGYSAWVTGGYSAMGSAATGTQAHEVAGGGEAGRPAPGMIAGPGWGDRYWETFGQEGGNAFNALGAAMNQFAGVSTDTFGQIGLVLAENLVGNLDNARMMLQTMGIGAQDLEEAFMQIGMSGEQTWQTVETFFQQIPALTGEGLVALGDVNGALEQITDSGGRGQTALLGLRNLAIEVGEQGGNSMTNLRDALIGSGKSAKETDIILQALAGRGIDSMDELKNASDRTLGGVIADMDSLGYEFSDAFAQGVDDSIKEIDKLRDTVSKIPDNVEKNLTINVKTKYQDSDAKGALGQINSNGPGLPRS